MSFQFNTYANMTDFAIKLEHYLFNNGFINESKDIKLFTQFYDLPSVYLGEFRIALLSILKTGIVTNTAMRKDVMDVINQINKAFDKANGINN